MDISDFAEKIGIPKAYIVSMANNADKCYNDYYISKRNGKQRSINAPNAELKGYQRWILDNILDAIGLNQSVHGYVKGKNIFSNAKLHCEKSFVVCVDISNFFPSITRDMVEEEFLRIVENSETAKIMSKLCTYKGSLPQGGVTSPTLSNLIFSKFDTELEQEAQQQRVVYTRYADDLAFSSNNKERATGMIIFLENLLKSTVFQLNPSKTRIMSGKQRICITGLSINRGSPSIGREKKKKIRAAIFNLFFKEDKSVSREKLFGTLSYLRSIEPDTYDSLKNYTKKIIAQKKALEDKK